MISPLNILFTGVGEISFTSLIIILVGLIILWSLVSIPVYIAAKVVTGGRASFLAAMGATILGPIVYSLTMVFASFFLSAVVGIAFGPLALFIAFIAWLAVYKSSFSTGWLGALFITILAAVIFVVISLFVVAMLGNTVPGRFFDMASI